MKTLLALCVCASVAGAAIPLLFRPLPSIGGAVSESAPVIDPSTIDGDLLGWWVGADYTTNAGVATVPDRAGSSDLTNAAATSGWPLKGPSLNGIDTLSFVSHQLRHTGYTSAIPHEVVMVCSWTNTGTKFAFDSANASFRNAAFHNGGQLQVFAGATLALTTTAPTNRWFVLNCLFTNSASLSTGFTNHVQTSAGNAGTQPISGLTLGANNTGSLNATLAFAELATFSGNLSSLARSNLNFYFTNKYGIAQ